MMNNQLHTHKGKEKTYDYWLKKNWYYHQYMAYFYQFMIPVGMRVLQVGCKTGNILSSVKPSYGVGLDKEIGCIGLAQEKYSQLHFFCCDIQSFSSDQKFDYIILSSTIMEVEDIQDLFVSLKKFCYSDTRIIIDFYSALWEPILRILQKCGLRRPTPLKNWISQADLENFLYLAGFEVVSSGKQLIFSMYIPGISWFLNTLFSITPFLNWLCLSTWLVAKKIQKQSYGSKTVSIIIPCRNEKGNIEAAVKRCPNFGEEQEIIFVEGHSQDGTLNELERVTNRYPEKNISYYVQEGSGKGDAVRTGFEKASGEILMILDADLTMPPEELPKFYNALIMGKGDFINGSRLVYGMENSAMRFLNLLANYCFALGFSWVLGQRVKDTLCGTKVLFKKDYEKIVKNRSYFGEFDPFGDFDLLFGAAKQHLKIIDLPVRYKARTYGTTQIRRFYHGLILLYMSWVGFLKFKLRH